MIKKIVALGMVLIGALIMLPFGFGLWNEKMSVSGQINIAVSSQAASEQPSAGAETLPSDSAAEGDNQTDNGQEAVIEESSNPDQTQSAQFTGDSSATLNPDSIAGEGAVVPEPVAPVEAGEITESLEPVPAPSE